MSTFGDSQSIRTEFFGSLVLCVLSVPLKSEVCVNFRPREAIVILSTLWLSSVLHVQAQQPGYKRRVMTVQEFSHFRTHTGVYAPGRNYNVVIDGFGTGLRPPSAQALEELRSQPVLIDGMQMLRALGKRSMPDHVDNSATPWFPPIGNQQGEGACVSWATGYYVKTFQEAREHGWDLSAATWSGTVDASHQPYIFSPDFIYHQVNGGVDEGSYYSDNIDLLHRIGCCTWDRMPYDESDSETWPSEAAWRQAPLYRSATGFGALWMKSPGALDALKQLLADGNLAVVSVNANLYRDLTDNDLWTTDNYDPDETNHANTIVGYDDAYGPYIENGNALTYGAFKCVNSWGVGGWETVDDGFISISYACLLERIPFVYSFQNAENYHPTALAVFTLTHEMRGACSVDLGIEGEGAPLVAKPFDDFKDNGGTHPYPVHAMALDISEFSPFITPVTQRFYLDVQDDASGVGGSIDQFSIEFYTDYDAGLPSAVYVSEDPVVPVPSGGRGRAVLFTGVNTVYVSPNPVPMEQTASDSELQVICTGSAPMPWTAAVSTGADWLSITAGSVGSGSGRIGLHCAENTGPDGREGQVVITAPWAENSPYVVAVDQSGTVEGLYVTVKALDGGPAVNAVVEVYTHRERVYDDRVTTDAGGTAHLPTLPAGTYDVLVYSYVDHFLHVLPGVDLPTVMHLEGSSLTPVTVSTVARDGLSPLGTAVSFTPWIGAHGYCGNTESTTGTGVFYVSDWTYTGVASVSFAEPHHLVHRHLTVAGAGEIVFDPVLMPTGEVNVHLQGFDDVALTHWNGYSLWAWQVPVVDGEAMLLSAGLYPHLDPVLELNDGSGNIWRYGISRDDRRYRNVDVAAGMRFDLYAGGAFEVEVAPDLLTYPPGATVSTSHRIHDPYGNHLDGVYGYIPGGGARSGHDHAYASRVQSLTDVRGGKTDVRDQAYQSVFPQLDVRTPSALSMVSVEEPGLFQGYDFTLPDPAEEGAYRVALRLETGPHQSIIRGDAVFYVGTEPASVTQTLSLSPSKLNLISFNVQPAACDIEDMLDDVPSLLVAQDDEGNFCIPPYSVNAIGEVDFSNGYQVYYTDANPASAVNEGQPLDPTAMTQNLTNTKLFMIGNPYQTAQNIETVFAAIADKIVVVQDDAGLFWIPAYGVNSIGLMQPGKGYQIFVDEALSFIYPAEAASTGGQMAKSILTASHVTPKHFNFTETGQSYAIVLTSSELPLSAGDEVGLYDGECCVGAAEFDGQYPLVIPAWQAVAQQGLGLPGYTAGHAVAMKVHRSGQSSLQPVTVTCTENGCYGQGGMTVLSVGEIEKSQAVPTSFKLHQNYPNPFNPETRIQVDLPESAQVNAVVYNVRGQAVRTLVNDQRAPGRYTLLWDGRDESGAALPSGLYLFCLKSGKHKKLIKMIYCQ